MDSAAGVCGRKASAGRPRLRRGLLDAGEVDGARPAVFESP